MFCRLQVDDLLLLLIAVDRKHASQVARGPLSEAGVMRRVCLRVQMRVRVVGLKIYSGNVIEAARMLLMLVAEMTMGRSKQGNG